MGFDGPLVGPLVGLGSLVGFGLSLWLKMPGPSFVGLHLIVDPISLEHLQDSIINPWNWVAITDHPTSSIYAPN